MSQMPNISGGPGGFLSEDRWKILTLGGMAIMLVILGLAGFLTFKAFASPTAPLGGMLSEKTPTNGTVLPSSTKSPSPKPTSSLTTTPITTCTISPDKWATGSDGWKISNGVLSNDGTGSFDVSGGPTIVAPSCQPPRPDYAVEVKIQVTPTANGGAFGIDVRAAQPVTGVWQGYSAYIDYSTAKVILSTIDKKTRNISSFDINKIGTKVHTYLVEAKGNTITFSIDGNQVATITDNKYTSPGQVGLWCSGVPLTVSSFKVVAL
jgi:hypothetical protein